MTTNPNIICVHQAKHCCHKKMASLKVQAQFLLSEDISNKSEPNRGYIIQNKIKTGRCAQNQIRIDDLRINKIIFNIF